MPGRHPGLLQDIQFNLCTGSSYIDVILNPVGVKVGRAGVFPFGERHVQGDIVDVLLLSLIHIWLGIRSFDGKRYYYYAHLRKNYPYHKTLQEGSVVQAGDVIGYLGRTGYSRTENTNNIDEPHLHFGLQLIFDESQKEGNNEIWVNCYELTKFLAMNRSETIKNQETKEYYRVYQMKDPAVPGGAVEQRYQ